MADSVPPQRYAKSCHSCFPTIRCPYIDVVRPRRGWTLYTPSPGVRRGLADRAHPGPLFERRSPSVKLVHRSHALTTSVASGAIPLADGEFTQSLDPVGGSLDRIGPRRHHPAVVVFVMLGVLKTKAYIAALVASSPRSSWRSSSACRPTWRSFPGHRGCVFGVFPIMWIVLAAICAYQLTVTSGRFEDLRAVFDSISEDPRVQPS